MSKFAFLIFFAFGPIYWLPNLSSAILSKFKFLCFALIVFTLIYNWMFNSKNRIYIRNIGFLVLTILIMFISLFFNQEGFSHYTVLSNYLVPLFIIMTMPFITSKTYDDLMWGVSNSTKVFALMAALIPLGMLIPSMVWINPIYDDPTLNLNQVQTGFGGGRTGWSIGASFILAASLANIMFKKNLVSRVVEIGCFIIIASSIFIPSGRGGIFAILFMLITFIILRSWIYKKIPFFSILLLVFSGVLLFNFAEFFRLDSLLRGDISEASNGRIEGNVIAIDMILRNPLLGVGIEKSDLTKFGLDYPEAHNVFLNFTMKFGLIAFFLVLTFFAFVVKDLFSKTKVLYNNYCFITFIFFNALIFVFSFTEPNIVFGNFFNTLIYWFVLGAFYINYINSKKVAKS
ncbi:O-antigen ligase [Acinetobacter oleivorans]|uniref:O-antigen ligase family protein n=1 Tax=uncultured Acinetobacter sp. TaxID=165433 RepID=UPI0025E61E46|nr:O-antigen ligase family protein [Acinetobacter oleivorans]